MNLSDLRNDLIRQEETIIFSLIERAQFCLNDPIYEIGALPVPGFTGCFSDYLLWETEKVHARVRRYTSPDEHPFFDDLPSPILPEMTYARDIVPNAISANTQIKAVYRNEILRLICVSGDDQNYGSSATCDVACLQALSKRIHYGKYVAEAKYQGDRGGYAELIRNGDRDGIQNALVNKAVEARLLERVALKAAAYGQEPGQTDADTSFKIEPQTIADIYRNWIIPFTIEVEVLYLLQRPIDDCG